MHAFPLRALAMVALAVLFLPATAQAHDAADEHHPADTARHAGSHDTEVDLDLAFLLQLTHLHRKAAEASGDALLRAPQEMAEAGNSIEGSELVATLSLGARWQAHLNLAYEERRLNAEEAWLAHTSTDHHWRLKAGRLLSAIGLANRQHGHERAFVDGSLMYQSLFGEHLRQDGVQLSYFLWTDPSAQSLELGAELGRGRDYPASQDAHGAASQVGYARWSSARLQPYSWQISLAALQARAQRREHELTDEMANRLPVAFSGRTQAWLLGYNGQWRLQEDFADSRPTVELQAELFKQKQYGQLDCLDPASCHRPQNSYRSRSYGGYLQILLRLPHQQDWQLGWRSERLPAASIAAGQLAIAPLTLAMQKNSLLLEHAINTRSRLRLQWSRQRLPHSALGTLDQPVWLQYIINLGPNTPHRH